jgi:aldose 1-epimerase
MTSDVLTFESSRANVEIDPVDGGRLTSLVIDGLDIIGSAAPTNGEAAGFFSGCFPMVPFAGITARGSFRFADTDWTLPLNAWPHAKHGLAFDRPWRVEASRLVFDFDERWPFGGRAVQEYDLDSGAQTVTLTVSNEERSMPVVAGFHPWFRRTLTNGAAAVFDVRPVQSYTCDDQGAPIGLVSGGCERPWDDSFLGMLAPPRITWGADLDVRIESDAEHWIVCETMPEAFCIEPLSGPVNGLASGEWTLVEPGRPLIHSMTIRWAEHGAPANPVGAPTSAHRGDRGDHMRALPSRSSTLGDQ